MAIKKSTFVGQNGRPFLHAPFVAMVPAEVIIEHTFNEELAAADILELAYLPAHCKVLSAELLTVGTAAITFDVGFVDGALGSTDESRTMDTAIFDGVTPTTMTVAALSDLAGIATEGDVRPIGVKPSGLVAASASTKLFLRLRYATFP